MDVRLEHQPMAVLYDDLLCFLTYLCNTFVSLGRISDNLYCQLSDFIQLSRVGHSLWLTISLA